MGIWRRAFQRENHQVREEPGAQRGSEAPRVTQLVQDRAGVRTRAGAALKPALQRPSELPRSSQGGSILTQSQSVISVSMVAKGRTPLVSATTALFAVSVYFRWKLQSPHSQKAMHALGPQSPNSPEPAFPVPSAVKATPASWVSTRIQLIL